MNVNVGPVFDEFVSDPLKSGLNQSQSVILRDGLRLLKEKGELKQMRLFELCREIAIGSAEAGCDEFVDGDETFAAIRNRSVERRRTKG